MAQNLREPSHPPFNVTQPRQLFRWLDVNAQGGPLTRTRGLIQFGGQSVNALFSWNGYYSDKIAQFNFTGAKNFSLLQDAGFIAFIQRMTLSTGLAGVFLVNIDLADHAADLGVGNIPINDVIRYSLTPHANTVGFTFPAYTGQPMKGQYFQIEFWTCGLDQVPQDFHVDLNQLVTFVTSVLGAQQDYRYGDDFTICSNQPTFTNQFAQTSFGHLDVWGLPITFLPETINGVNQ